MPIVNHTVLRNFIYDIYRAADGADEDARIVSNHVVDSNLVGHDSHGVINALNYVSAMKGGPSADRMEIIRENATSAVIDGHRALGMVAATKAMELTIQKAEVNTIGAVGLHQCGHAGRMGEYPPMAARAGMIGVVLLNGGGRFMHPFGGTSRRLPPNPVAISVPRREGEPLLLDMTLSVIAGGKMLVKVARGEEMPEGWMIDSDGIPVTDPNDFLNRTDDTAVMPLGGFQFGHKGFGLGFMVDAIAGGLSWAGCTRSEPTRGGSGIVMIAIKIDEFIDLDVYVQEIEYMIEWVKSSARLPGIDEIYVPGEFEERNLETRSREGIPIEEPTWDAIVEKAKELGVDAPQVL
ncbi:MAG: Ldh family oxidoreductase [Candidatus Poribacteria bacterium]|nr:Ldh family oxidoreductase [Candidatus Poribacteria bacterium]